MKLPAVFDRLVHKAPPEAPRFLSLVLDELYVQSAVWSIGQRDRPVVVKSDTQRLPQDSWEARVEASDQSLTALDEDGSVGDLHKVVLGLSSVYLTASGDIDANVRPHIKALCKELELVAIGFVSLPQAIIHKLKTEEGVPPTVILLSVSDGRVTVSLYKVGVLAGEEAIATDEIVPQLETTLKGWKDVEVLPSRMLLYGTDSEKLEEIKNTLLRHPWPTRVAFLHFPKIDVLPKEFAVEAVSEAGAGEMATEIGEEEIVQSEKGQEVIESEKTQQVEVTKEEDQVEEESNVIMVEPESLGFAKGRDVLEEEIEEEIEEKPKRKIELPKIVIPSISIDRVRGLFDNFQLPIGGLPIVGIFIILLILIGFYVWFIPHATVTVLTLSKVLEETTPLTVNPAATVADAATKTIPGKNQEKVISGEKTTTVSGKKDVGDPAKGTVTIYNKSLSERTFKKGAVLLSGSLHFTLDDDVKVASASESIGSITFGKANGSVTAVEIGSKSNLPAGTEFTFQDISSSVAIGRNDQPLTGGTSKEVTVVSRADYDAFVKALSADLVEKAKTELASGVAGREKLIDATIQSNVTEKTFKEELDQEAKELHGKLTVKVSGTSYNEEDIAAIFKQLVNGKIPSDYTLVSDQTTMKVTDVKVKKDGSITLSAKIQGAALPTLHPEEIAKALAGKSVTKAEAYLRNVTGVAGMEVGFRWWPIKSRLPFNKNNISISIALQE
ncbi:baseplate J/gp47 family protein [Candidatus Gottesmanbacteria bacterium]|nr:baseplate J/gp47 family protein [Candidatus Gottesmanbacteria bacterium]